jgi:pimeloyl-ACP methyl ester carboxylesterase
MRTLLFLLALSSLASGAQLDVLKVEGQTLRDNPLGDPPQRRAAVLSPKAVVATTPLPVVLYLPGWGGSSEDTISQSNGGWLGRVVDDMAANGKPLRIVTVDGRSRYGGSQFVNSTATGRYADYVAHEVLAAVRAKFATTPRAIVSGHSSGGYGALLLAMDRQTIFRAVVALSPDSDFETTHKSLVEQAAVLTVTAQDLLAAMAPARSARIPSGLAGLVMGLCANYAPRAGHPGEFEWLYDARGQWRPEVWAKWIAADPLTQVRDRKTPFTPEQRIYLDGPEFDEFGANIGGRKIERILQQRRLQVQFHQPAGHHSDRLPERLTRGLLWVLEK